MLKIKVWFWSLGSFFLLTFCLFVAWNLAASNPAYIRLLETFLPGFRWITPVRFVVGALESFIYGAYISLLFVPIHNLFYRMHHPQANVKTSKTAA
ncbi:MAG: hypothetical protein DMG65_13980 [Candidatus Angelobacter sp. Gp1-AA117]|nr:MAG: hypothetical protein DMG65_13980 [Candidatus Angelobacter sp. Gp1-AA117]